MGSPGNLDRLKEGWVDLLGRVDWEWLATLTFRNQIHPEAADKRFRVFRSMINRDLYGTRWHKKGKGIDYARALEMQRRGVIHFHALFGGVQDLSPFQFMGLWDYLAGFAKIEPIKQGEAVRNYVSKYITKGGEIDIGGPWARGIAQLPQLAFAAKDPSQVSGPGAGGGVYRGVREPLFPPGTLDELDL